MCHGFGFRIHSMAITHAHFFCLYILSSFSIAFIVNMSFNSKNRTQAMCKQALNHLPKSPKGSHTHEKCQTAVCLYLFSCITCVRVSVCVCHLRGLYEWTWIIAINWTACSLYNRRVIPFYLWFLSRFRHFSASYKLNFICLCAGAENWANWTTLQIGCYFFILDSFVTCNEYECFEFNFAIKSSLYSY